MFAACTETVSEISVRWISMAKSARTATDGRRNVPLDLMFPPEVPWTTLRELSQTTKTSTLGERRNLNFPALTDSTPASTTHSTALLTDGSARTMHIGPTSDGPAPRRPMPPKAFLATDAGNVATSSAMTNVTFMPRPVTMDENGDNPLTMRNDGSCATATAARSGVTTIARSRRSETRLEAGVVLRISEHLLVIGLVI